MLAYEFQAAVNDGIIYIPAEYKNKVADKVKVIILSEETIERSDDNKNNKKASFPYFAVDTTGYFFDREEANER